jgi:hypothetical protein
MAIDDTNGTAIPAFGSNDSLLNATQLNVVTQTLLLANEQRQRSLNTDILQLKIGETHTSQLQSIFSLVSKYFDDLNAKKGDEEEERKELLASLKGLKENQGGKGSSPKEKDETKDRKGMLGFLGSILNSLIKAPLLFLAGLGSLGLGKMIFGKGGFATVKFSLGLLRGSIDKINKFNSKIFGIDKFKEASKKAKPTKSFNKMNTLAKAGVSQNQMAKMPNVYGKEVSNIAKQMSPKEFQQMRKGSGRMNAIMRGYQKFIGMFDKFKKPAGPPKPSGAGKLSKLITGFKNSIQAMLGPFRVIGKMFGAIFAPLRIIFTIFETVKGAIQGFNRYGKDGSIFSKLVGGVLGGIGGAFKAIVGYPLDLLKSIVAWILGKFGLNNAAEYLKGFSFTKMIGDFFGAISDKIVGFFSNITSAFDQGMGPGLANLAIKLAQISTKIMRFPLALVAGGLAGVLAITPGGKSPKEAFFDAFNGVMNFGDSAFEGAQKLVGVETQTETDARIAKEVAEAEKARLEKKEADRARKLKEESERKQAALEEQERLQREETRRLSGGGTVMDNSQTSVTNNSYSGALDGASDSGPPPEFAMLMGLAGLG